MYDKMINNRLDTLFVCATIVDFLTLLSYADVGLPHYQVIPASLFIHVCGDRKIGRREMHESHPTL